MSKRVLAVGNCDYDHGSIRSLIEDNFEARVARAHGPKDTMAALRAEDFDLVVINRRLLRDQSDGIAIIEQMKADDRLGDIPVMLITNYPEHQQRAIAAGAKPGFGKAQLLDPATLAKLREFLDHDADGDHETDGRHEADGRRLPGPQHRSTN